jgi:hypothetical protein
MKHYKYGGSTAGRTVACPSWATLAENMPAGPSSTYAEEGTALHQCMEMLLLGQLDAPADVLGKDICGVTIEPEHLDRLNMALTSWDNFCSEYNVVDFMTEQTFELTGDIGGTADVIAWSNTVVYIVDWKFGQGIEVSAENSAQGMFYALCAQHTIPDVFKNKDMAVVIIQPIPSRDHETLKVWKVPADTFKHFRTSLFDAIEYDGPPEYRMGAHCTFCPAASLCPQKTGAAVAALLLKPDDLETLAGNLESALQLKAWIKSVETKAHEQLEGGAKLNGFKLVASRAVRKWRDAVAAEKTLRKMVRSSKGDKSLKVTDVFTHPKLLSPPQIEKVLKAKKLDFDRVGDYIENQSSGTTLAREGDKRPAILSKDALRSALGRIS